MPTQTKVLLVDEDSSVRQALGRALSLEDFSVVPAASGREAIQRFGEFAVDVLLLNINSPKSSGWDTVRRLTALKPLLPVVVISGHSSPQEPANAHEVDVWMEKPLDLPVLIQSMKELASQPPELRRQQISQRSERTNNTCPNYEVSR